jgi:predicted acyl esterase
VPYFQEWLRHPEPDDYWASMDHRRNVVHMPDEVLLAGGWYDFFLPAMLADYAALRATGRDVRLLVGPWSHGRGMTSHVVGPVTAEIHLRSSLAHTDVFARLCDVAPNGRSTNLCDGLLRLGPRSSTVDGVRLSRVELWPMAHRFRRGHRIRLHVSSRAHPRFARNLGTGDPLGAAMYPADQEIFHDPERPSALLLPQRQRPGR